MDPNADPFAQMMAMLNGGAGGAGGAGPEGMPDMSRLFAQMMGGAPPGSGPQGGMPNLLGMGDLDDPAGLGGTPPLNAAGMPNFPDMSAFANMPGMQGMPGMGMGAPQGKGWVEKLYPLVHFIAILLLLAFATVWWEPTIRAARWADVVDDKSTLGRWARLAGRVGGRQVVASGVLGNVEVLVCLPLDCSERTKTGHGEGQTVARISVEVANGIADLLGFHHPATHPPDDSLLYPQGKSAPRSPINVVELRDPRAEGDGPGSKDWSLAHLHDY